MIETDRLRLRQWRDSDRAPFAAMNADPEVMEFFASAQSREASDASIAAWQSQWAERGFSNWANELLSSPQTAGALTARAARSRPARSKIPAGNARRVSIHASQGDHETSKPRRASGIVLSIFLLVGAGPSLAAAAPDGTLTFAMHFSPVTRWLDPAEGESTITPYRLLYALHDGLLKPMPGVGSAPSHAESWSMAKDGRSAEFTQRPGIKFHNGDPVTSSSASILASSSCSRRSTATGARHRRSSGWCSEACPTRPRARPRSRAARSTSPSC